jgi:hypothetical protein
MGEQRNTHRLLIGKPEEKRSLGRQRYKWVDNIKIHLREIAWGVMNWIDLAYERDQQRAFMNTVLKLRVS